MQMSMMRLTRLEPGTYETLDRRYRVVADAPGHNNTEWKILDLVTGHRIERVGSLRAAREKLMALRRRAEPELPATAALPPPLPPPPVAGVVIPPFISGESLPPLPPAAPAAPPAAPAAPPARAWVAVYISGKGYSREEVFTTQGALVEGLTKATEAGEWLVTRVFRRAGRNGKG